MQAAMWRSSLQTRCLAAATPRAVALLACSSVRLSVCCRFRSTGTEAAARVQAVELPQSVLPHADVQLVTKALTSPKHTSTAADGNHHQQQLQQPQQPRRRRRQQQAVVTAPPPKLLIVEAFAGSHPVAFHTQRELLRAGAGGAAPAFALAAYAAVELEPQHGVPTAGDLRLPEERFLNITGSVSDQATHDVLLAFVRARLAQTGNNRRVDGVLVFGGPPCTEYSQAKVVSKMDPLVRKRKLEAADALVASFLRLFKGIEAECSGSAGGARPAFLVMENPQSRPDRALWNRPFMTREHLLELPDSSAGRRLMKDGAFTSGKDAWLRIVRQHWCCYGDAYPKKPTTIFTNLPGTLPGDASSTPLLLPATSCPKECKHEGPAQGHYRRHKVTMQGMGDCKVRAVWPAEFVAVAVQACAAHVAEARRRSSC